MTKAIYKPNNLFLNIWNSPKIVLLLLSLINLLYVPFRYQEFCYYNWRYAFYDAVLVLIAAIAVCISKPWSYLAAAAASGWIFLKFYLITLQHLGWLPFSLGANDFESGIKFEHWLSVMRLHPEEFTHTILAALILVVALFYVSSGLKQRRRVFK